VMLQLSAALVFQRVWRDRLARRCGTHRGGEGGGVPAWCINEILTLKTYPLKTPPPAACAAHMDRVHMDRVHMDAHTRTSVCKHGGLKDGGAQTSPRGVINSCRSSGVPTL
jgi:hypothetical protein